MSQRILVLGGTGMLGAMMVRVLREQGMDVTATRRDRWSMPEERRRHFDASDFVECPDPEVGDNGLKIISESDWIINCIGITKPVIDTDPSKGKKSAIEINALFPHVLARSLSSHQRIIQIATDCVYSGRTGGYKETDPHDALDVYGKTKSLGETNLPNVMTLRCSIIGPEYREQKKFLLEWLLGQAQGATVPGFPSHTWNGLTTLHFAKVCAGIIKNERLFSTGIQHLIAGHHYVTKAHLLERITHSFGRPDLEILPKDGPAVHRHLATNEPGKHYALWQGAGYEEIPTVEEMVHELAEYMRCSTIGDITRKRL